MEAGTKVRRKAGDAVIGLQMTLATCEGCERTAKIGNGIMYVKVYTEKGKRISIALCSKCEQQIETRPRPEKPHA